MGLITLGRNFLHWTFSVIIAGHLVNTKNKIWRTFWTLLLILTLIAFFLHSASNVIEYFSYEKTTVIQLFTASTAPFPAVTICNLNPFKNSAINNSATISNLISAYKYTLEQKDASSADLTEHVRKKRAPPSPPVPSSSACDKTQQASVKAPSQPAKQNYVIEGFSCNPSYYNLTYQLCGRTDLSITLPNVSTINYNVYKTDIDKGVYLCFHDLFCVDFCNTWDTGLDALTNLTECAKANFNYPPETDGFNFMALIAEGYSSYCNLNDKGCKLGLYKKKSKIYPGNYWYKDCYVGQYFSNNANLVSMTMEGCDNSTTYEFDTYLLSTCTGYIKNISDTFSNVLDETDCGTVCGKTCPLTGTNLCFYNQQDLCYFYQKCTTTGSSKIPQSSTTKTSASTTSKQSTTSSATTKTSISSTPQSSASSAISTSKSTVSMATALTSTSSTKTIPNSETTTTEYSKTPTFSTTTPNQNEELMTAESSDTSSDLSSTTSTLKNEKTTPMEELSSSSETKSYSTTTFSDVPPIIVSSTVKSSTQLSTDSSSRATALQSTQQTSSTHNFVTTSQNTKTSTSATSTTSQNPLTLGTLNTIKWPTFPTIKPWTTSNFQIITSKSSKQSSSTKTPSIISSTHKAPATSTNARSTKAITTISVTSSSIATTASTEKPTSTSTKNPTNYGSVSTKTTALSETIKSNPTNANTKSVTNPLTPFETTTPSNIVEITTKPEIPDNSEITTNGDAQTGSKTKTFNITTKIPTDNSENGATTVADDNTDIITSDSVTVIDSKTPLLLTTTAGSNNQIISSTSKINTSPNPDTIHSSSKATDIVVKTTSSIPTSLITITKNNSTKMSTFPSSTKKQDQSSTVKINYPTTSKIADNSKTTTVKPKTTTKNSPNNSKTSTKATTTENFDKTTATKSVAISTLSSSQEVPTEITTQSSESQETTSLSATTTTIIPLSTKQSTSQSDETNFLNQTLPTTFQSDITFAITSTTITTPNLLTSVTTTSTQPTQQISARTTTSNNFTTTTNSVNELEKLSKDYKLNSSQASITIETNAQKALISLAASLSDAEKNALGYKIGDLIQTCIIDGVPCNIERDFQQIYDVDYGFCYTFNSDAIYNTTQSGASHGLKMVVLSDINEYMATSSEQGIKIVVHPQDEYPFPNADGYRSAIGKEVDLRVTYGIVSRLDSPYGSCNSLEKLKELNQPFYYNGTYSVEGCYRSCFQQKISIACNCSDPRFPLPNDLSTSFCQISDTKKYACYEKYIKDNGDYYHVKDCSCDVTCDETTFTAKVYYANWPYGTFFYQALCTDTTLINGTDQENCQKFYQKNAVSVLVSYARLGYETLEEQPVNSAYDLFNNLAGNTGLWIGFSAITLAEFILIFAQICLWICTPWELMEVPSCRRRNYPEPETDSENTTEETNSTTATTNGSDSAAGSLAAFNSFYPNLLNGMDMNKSRHLFQPKSFPNDLRRRHPGTMVADPSSIYESITPVSHVDAYDSQLISPTPVQSTINETVPEL